jgi:hypothetical protein
MKKIYDKFNNNTLVKQLASDIINIFEKVDWKNHF